MADHTKRQRTIEEAYRCEGGSDIQGREFLLLDRKQVINTIWNMQESLMVLSPDANVWFVNKAAEDMLGFNICEMLGMPVGKFVADDNLEFFNAIRNVVKGGEIRGMRLDYIAKDGERIPVSINAGDLRDSSTNMLLGMIIVAKDMRDVLGLIEELKDAKANLEDKVKERTKELEDALKELKQTQAQLLQREKMASIGQLAAGIAHEINNPLSFISSNLRTMEDYIDTLLNYTAQIENPPISPFSKGGREGGFKKKEIKEELNEIKKESDIEFIKKDIMSLITETRQGAERVKNIVKDLREFSQIDSIESTYADIHGCIETTLNMLANDIGQGIRIIKDYKCEKKVKCYAGEINQVFMSILLNARDAIDGHGEIRINTYNNPPSPSPLWGEGRGEGQNVFIEIIDTGRGMSDGIKNRVFEPFFTTKGVGKGTGLGLTMTYNIIKRHNGSIDVESEIGKGTRFVIRLPIE